MTSPPSAADRYADWKAPAGDGQFLLWPGATTLVAQTRENHTALSSGRAGMSVRIGGVPLVELRRRMRHWIGHTDDARPLVATGHQTELYHPGVWAKHAMMNALADAVDGDAYFLAVDTDAPKHLQIRWPGGGGAITDDPQLIGAQWSGLMRQPTPAHLAALRDELRLVADGWEFAPAIEPFFDAMTKLGMDETVPLSAAITNAAHALDWSLGLRHHAMLASPMFFSEPFLALVHHVCADAGAFATAYNAALHEYRTENGIDNPGRPMPDLRATTNACEVPLWLDDLTDGSRQRATLMKVDGRWVLVRPDDAFSFDPATGAFDAAAALAAWLRRANLRLAPRALTLTMFFRLLLVDQFVHGIGGGRYDQVLDKLIAGYFKIDPPHFSVATATLFFPTATTQERVCLPCLKQEGHQLKHRVLGDAKMELVGAIAAAPRKSLERAALFSRMHRQLDARARDARLLDWERRLSAAEQLFITQRTLFDRELFYGIQSRQRLEGIIGQFREAFGV
jgi:hypothetical protein